MGDPKKLHEQIQAFAEMASQRSPEVPPWEPPGSPRKARKAIKRFGKAASKRPAKGSD